MKETLVSINITSKKELKNPNGSMVPILYDYVDNGDSIINELFLDDKFKEYIYSLCYIEDYPFLKLSYFFFDYNNDEKYESDNVYIQKIFTLDKIDKENIDRLKNLKYLYILDNLEYLYRCSYKNDYAYLENKDFEYSIKDIYKLLKEKNPNKITKETVVNYVRSELTKDKLSQENVDYIINKFNKILYEL